MKKSEIKDLKSVKKYNHKILFFLGSTLLKFESWKTYKRMKPKEVIDFLCITKSFCGNSIKIAKNTLELLANYPRAITNNLVSCAQPNPTDLFKVITQKTSFINKVYYVINF